MKYAIGVDLGGTKTEIMLTHADNVLNVIERQRVPTHRERGYDFILQQLAQLIQNYQRLSNGPTSIGIGMPGSLSPFTGKVRCANTQCLNEQSFKEDLESLVQAPVHIENDANCFALSEALLGHGQNQDLVFGVIMGTGFGGGIVQNGKLWRGHTHNAGEWGHMGYDPNGPLCPCGLRGCVEMYLSGTGFQRMYEEASGLQSTVAEIHQKAKVQKDPVALQVFDNYLQIFGRVMASLISSFDPSMIILGGGVSNLDELYTEGVASIQQQLFGGEFHTPIVKNQLGDSSGIYGAALLAC